MAIYNEEINQVSGGFKKTIDPGSERMVLDSYQKLQYQYPYKSTIRELASNGIDAIRERDIARAILQGKTTVEEHYVRIEGDQYKDSYFDPSYYDLNWLSEDPNVYITYEETTMNRDKLIIKDNGVGLWGKRLMGYFSLAYSTKRLSRFGLGKFGVGAKAALSTGVPSYTVINRYNGKEMWFTVYSYQVVPAIPKFAADGSINKSFVLTKDDAGNEVICYYYDTTEKNGLEIHIESKKHNKSSYADAVRSQLLYFDNVMFKIVHTNGIVENIPTKATILYEDDIMILSDNNMYTKPHILVNRVNYGNIDFQELELEDRIGNISIKMPAEEVSIGPSRESILWDEVTQKAVIKKFKQVQATGELLLQKELDETDFLKWIRNSVAYKQRMNSGTLKTLVGRLAAIVDLDGHIPVYKPDPRFRLDNTLFTGMSVRLIRGITKREGSLTRMVVDRTQAKFSDILSGQYPIIVQRSETSHNRDKYLLEDHYQDGFITIKLNEMPAKPDPGVDTAVIEQYEARRTAMHMFALDTAKELKIYTPSFPVDLQKRDSSIAEVLHRWDSLNQYICASEGVQTYESFVVPDRVETQGEEDATEENEISRKHDVQTAEARQSAEERRKLSGKTVLFTPRTVSTVGYGKPPHQIYEWHKLEVPVADIDHWSNDEVYYASESDSSLLVFAAAVTRPKEEYYVSHPYGAGEIARCENFKDDRPVRLVKVAQNRARYYRDFKPIRQFFAEVKNKVLTMSNSLIKWNTARFVHKHMSKLRFLTNFHVFDHARAEQYRRLCNYCKDYYRPVEELADPAKYKAIQKEEYDDLLAHMDRVADIQLFVREHSDDPEAIAARVKEILGAPAVEMVNDGAALDINIYDSLQDLLEYAEPVQVLLNEVGVLTNSSNVSMSDELETEIRNFIKMKQAGISITSPNTTTNDGSDEQGQ